MKRAPTELVDHIISRAQASIIDDDAVRAQYKECKMWQRWVSTTCRTCMQPVNTMPCVLACFKSRLCKTVDCLTPDFWMFCQEVVLILTMH